MKPRTKELDLCLKLFLLFFNFPIAIINLHFLISKGKPVSLQPEGLGSNLCFTTALQVHFENQRIPENTVPQPVRHSASQLNVAHECKIQAMRKKSANFII